MRGTTATTLALAAALAGCSAVLGIHDIPPPDDGGQGSDGSAQEGGSPGDATTPDAPVHHDGGQGDVVLDAAGDPAQETPADSPAGCLSDAGGEVVGIAGCPCSNPTATACTGVGQTGLLVCSAGGTWTSAGGCGSGKVCDPHPGPLQGTCVAVDPLCLGLGPGAYVCSDDVTVAKCTSDLLSHVDVQTCTGQACIGGVCTGTCMPGTVLGCPSPTKVDLCGTNGQPSTQDCVQPTPDCGQYIRNGQPQTGCTCYGHLRGIDCVDPVELGPSGSPGYHVEVDSTTVYWSDQGTLSCNDAGSCTSNHDAHISTIPIGGGPSTFAQAFLPQGVLFRVNSSGIYWTDSSCPADGGGCTGTLMTRAFDAGAPVAIGSAPMTMDFALDDTAAYVAEYGVGLVRVPLDGSAQTTLVSSSQAQRVAIDATTAYVTDFGGDIFDTPLTGGAPTLFTTTVEPSAIAFDTANVYWQSVGCQDASLCFPVLATPVGGGSAVTLAAAAQPSRLVAWGGNLYFTDDVSILYVPVGGGAVNTLAAPQGGVRDFALDATSVYWADSSGIGVWKIAHP